MFLKGLKGKRGLDGDEGKPGPKVSNSYIIFHDFEYVIFNDVKD